MLSPYWKSRAINYGMGANSVKEANIARLQDSYKQVMHLSLEYEPDAKVNGVSRRIIANKAKGTHRCTIQSYPGETFHAGDLVECYGSTWIIIEVNANKDIYTTGTMLRCNHLFRFQNGTSEIVERWGVLDTGVYSTTVKETETQTLLNKQYKIYLPLDEATERLYIGKRIATGVMKDEQYRDVLTVYRLTEFDSVSENYGDDALLVMKCISDQYNQNTDNFALRICDYIDSSVAPPAPAPSALNAAIEYSGEAIVRIGGTGKTFRAFYTDESGNAAEGAVSTWKLEAGHPEGMSLVDNGDGTCRLIAEADVMDASLMLLVLHGQLGEAEATCSLVVEAVVA